MLDLKEDILSYIGSQISNEALSSIGCLFCKFKYRSYCPRPCLQSVLMMLNVCRCSNLHASDNCQLSQLTFSLNRVATKLKHLYLFGPLQFISLTSTLKHNNIFTFYWLAPYQYAWYEEAGWQAWQWHCTVRFEL